jgi:hypothetical protein
MIFYQQLFYQLEYPLQNILKRIFKLIEKLLVEYHEVKSTWTYNIDRDMINAKMNACKEQGYNYEIWIYDGSRQKQIVK